MPRPRVRPEDRQRAAKACLPCKSSKKRCDAQQPCSNCVRRRAASSCSYAESSHVRHQDGRRKQSASQTHYSEDVDRTSVDESNASQETPECINPASRELHHSSNTAPTPRRLTTGGRLLLNSKGEKGMRLSRCCWSRGPTKGQL